MKKLYKINQFTSQEWDAIEYDWDAHEDEIVIIEKKNKYCMDITANGKRIVPILRKIEESMTKAGLAGENGVFAGWFGEWANSLTNRQDRKYFIWNYSGRQDIDNGCWSYSWGIEELDDGLWYIFLNIAKPQQEATEEPQETEEQTTKEEKSMESAKSTKKISFEIRQLDAWGNAEEGYEINTSYLLGTMATKAQNERKAFTDWLRKHCGIIFKKNRTLIEFDGDCYTIIDRKTKEPLFIAIYQF